MRNQIAKVRNKLNNLPETTRRIVRIAYPIVLYIIAHFTAVAAGVTDLRPVQFGFLLFWGLLEYLFFFRRS
jgi:hypothetical protein